MVCRLKKSLYRYRQALRQRFLRFDEVVTSFGFKEIIVDQCIYLKVIENKFIILVLYVNNIFLVSNDISLLHVKRMLSKTFEMKDPGDASVVLGIEIHRNRSRELWVLYIDSCLKGSIWLTIHLVMLLLL